MYSTRIRDKLQDVRFKGTEHINRLLAAQTISDRYPVHDSIDLIKYTTEQCAHRIAKSIVAAKETTELVQYKETRIPAQRVLRIELGVTLVSDEWLKEVANLLTEMECLLEVRPVGGVYYGQDK